jgi:hypothetical protein
MSKCKGAKASIAKIVYVALRDKKARCEYEQAQGCKSQNCKRLCVLHCEIRKQGASMSKRKGAKASVANIVCVALQK